MTTTNCVCNSDQRRPTRVALGSTLVEKKSMEFEERKPGLGFGLQFPRCVTINESLLWALTCFICKMRIAVMHFSFIVVTYTPEHACFQHKSER